MNHHDRDRDRGHDHNRSGTPPRPPYSPVTPVFTHLAPVPGFASIGPPASSPSPTTTSFPPADQYDRGSVTTTYATTTTTATPAGAGGVTWTDTTFSQKQPQPQPQPPMSFVPEPSPVPISESDNPDAIALRSAISILQLQKQQSVRDIRTLEKMKQAAGADPERFARQLANGRLTSDQGQGEDGAGFINFRDEEDGEDEEDEEEEGPHRKPGEEGEQGSPFGKIPKPQNVIRMPPVNWAKYHIVGEPLEKLHEEQLKRPVGGEPRRGNSAAGFGAGAGGAEMISGPVSQQQQERAPEYLLAAPYRPLVDKVESQTASPSKGKDSPKKQRKP